jgi:hypothetical protein
MSRLLIGASVALFMALTPSFAQEKPASGEGTTPAAKEQNTTAPAIEDADPGRTGGGGAGAGGGAGGAGAGGAGAGAGGAGGAGGGAGGGGGG